MVTSTAGIYNNKLNDKGKSRYLENQAIDAEVCRVKNNILVVLTFSSKFVNNFLQTKDR